LRKTEISFGKTKLRNNIQDPRWRQPSVYRIGDMVSVDPRTRPGHPNSDGGIAYLLEIKKMK
jgi:hypothetical protein